MTDAELDRQAHDLVEGAHSTADGLTPARFTHGSAAWPSRTASANPFLLVVTRHVDHSFEPGTLERWARWGWPSRW